MGMFKECGEIVQILYSTSTGNPGKQAGFPV